MRKNLASCLIMFCLTLIPSVGFAQGGKGYLRTKVKPPVAGVFIDGKYQGTASIFAGGNNGIPLDPGNYTVRLVDPRYKVLEAKVEIKAGEKTVIRETLTPLPLASPPFGLLKVKNAKRQAVYLNGAYYGQADEFNGPGQGLLLNPGEYNLRIVSAAGADVKNEKVSITANQTTKIQLP